MPYKDPEARRIYERDYKRRRRMEKTAATPNEPRRKAYICPAFPHFRLPGIVFKNGFFVTADETVQAVIERHPAYGIQVFSWVLEP